MKCRECEHCKRIGGTVQRGKFFCEHPNQSYILDYFSAKHMVKMPGFIGFGENFSHKPLIKTSPAWCPLKAKNLKYADNETIKSGLQSAT